MQTEHKRILIWLPVAAGILVGLAAAFAPRPVPVDLFTVRPATMVVSVDEEGETRVHDVFGLSAPVTGRLRRIEAHVGDPVQAGNSVLARIEPADPAFLDPRSEAQGRAALQAAESAMALAAAEIERARAEFEFSQSEHKRIRELARSGTISVRELDSAERAYRSSQATLATAQAGMQVRSWELEQAKAQLLSPTETRHESEDCDCVTLKAPVDGQVLRVIDDSERVVNAGELLIEIGNPLELEVVVDFLSTDAVKIQPGHKVIIERWGGPQALPAIVRHVEPYGFRKISALGIEEQRVNVIIDFTGPVDSRRSLGHGYQLEARVVLWQSDTALSVPLTALFRKDGDWALFVREGERAVIRPVAVGQRNGIEAEIIDGLEEGEQVVLHPGSRVTDGVRITSR